MVKSAALATACLALGFAAGALAMSGRGVTVPIGDAKFVPVDPARPSGPRNAVLMGDPATGPSDMLLAFGRGGGTMHVHSADYHLVVVKGVMKHWDATGSEAATPEMGPGSYWFQPGGEAHADACLSDECLMFIRWDGKRDGRLAEPAK